MFRLPGLTRCSGTRGIFGTSSGKTLHSYGAAGFTLPAGVLKLAPREGGSRAAGQGTPSPGSYWGTPRFPCSLQRISSCSGPGFFRGKPSGATQGGMGVSSTKRFAMAIAK